MHQDEPEVRIFTLADWAKVPPDNKLYMGGGGVTQVFLESIPGTLPLIYLVARVRIPWRLTTEEVVFEIRALDADRRPLGPDPLIQATGETGRPPGARPGDEFCFQFVLPLGGFPIATAGNIFFHLSMAGGEVASLPLKVAMRPAAAPRQEQQ